MRTSITLAGYILAIALLSAACTDSTDNTGIIEQKTTYNLRGKAEKGPYVQGSRVTIFELNASYAPTGRSFIADIGNDDGSFSLNNVELISPYTLLDANGFYFNEVSGKLSNAQINLTALVDLRQNATVNVNPLTHLERRRVEKLLAEGKNFTKAKEQAQREVLAVFGLSAEWQAEQAELCGNDAILLTVSSILQGFRSEAELTMLMNIFAQDIAKNGELTNEDLLASLSNDASRLSAEEIRNNLSAHYLSIGVQTSIPDLVHVFAGFLEQNPPVNTGITYPETGRNGINLLSADTDTLRVTNKIYPYNEYSFAAELEEGCSLKVCMYGEILTKRVGTALLDTTLFFNYRQYTNWGFVVIEASKSVWEIGVYDNKAITQTFTVAGKASAELPTQITTNMLDGLINGNKYIGTGKIKMDIYENDAATPTRTKMILIEVPY